jgi:aspartyl aminopeptidase
MAQWRFSKPIIMVALKISVDGGSSFHSTAGFAKTTGSFVDIRLGEDEGGAKFCITIFFPIWLTSSISARRNHLVKVEELNVVIGSRPFKDERKASAVKLAILKLLYEKYGIVERDFLSAELELVPAYTVDDIGFDRSMIGGYGHDDRVCAYPAFEAILDIDDAPEYTAITVLTDKEEIGSDGNTGLNSNYMQYFIED